MYAAKHFRKPLLQSATAVMMMSGTLVAYAQESTGFLEEVIVTAQKRQENVNDVGMSITAISGDQLLKAGIAQPEDLVKAVPGFSFTRSPYGVPVYTLRGIGFYSTNANAAPAVSVYQDEIPLPYSFMTPGAGFDVQHVEVLKGPQGTLFGQNSTGGAINYIANKPTKELAAGGDLSYSSYDLVTANGYISGPISSTVSARLSVHGENGGAWQKSYTRGDSHGDRRFYAGRALVDWQPTDALKVEFNVNGWKDKSDEQAAQFVALIPHPPATLAPLTNAAAQYPTSPPNARYADWDPPIPLGGNDAFFHTDFDKPERDNYFIQGALRAEYNLTSNTTLTSITAWSEADQRSFVDTDGMNVASYHVVSFFHINTFSQELRLSGDTGRLKWVFGGNYSNDQLGSTGIIFTARPNYGTFRFRSAVSLADNTIGTWAAFGHTEYSLTDKLSLLAGIRYTHVNNHNAGCTASGADGDFGVAVVGIAASRGVVITPPGPGACATLNDLNRSYQPGLAVSTLKENNVPFKVGVNYKVSPDALLYASLSKGYKVGSFSPVGASVASQLRAATQESVVAYEAGFKVGLADRRVQLNGAAFYYDYKDKQVIGKIVTPDLGPQNSLINIPKSQIIGGELQLAWAPIESLVLNVGTSYTYSKIVGTTFANNALGAPENLKDQTLPFTPKLQLISDAEYSIQVGTGLEAFVGGGARYQSKSYSGLGEEGLFEIDPYGTIDLRTGVRSQSGRWSVTGFVNNVTDKYSWNFVGLNGPDIVTRIANQPRIYGIRFSAKL